MDMSNLVEHDVIHKTAAENTENRPLNILLLFGVALLVWGFTIGIFRLLIAGLTSIQFSFLDYISLL